MKVDTDSSSFLKDGDQDQRCHSKAQEMEWSLWLVLRDSNDKDVHPDPEMLTHYDL